MKFIISTALLALATATSAVSIPRAAAVRTVVFTNEYSGRGQAADIPTTGVDVSVPASYPLLYNPFRIDSVQITGGVVSGAYCKVHGTSTAGQPVVVAEVNGERNYAKLNQDVQVRGQSLKINCV
ncbi:hypothetical protein BJY04DRAFT_218106 [Aspergillus karnatakaensis]|uniref:uncharacterized protein n=1 Tax=Aspergillus karnatakaensis TaxID=1810916 RepID=UPI003CCE52ED